MMPNHRESRAAAGKMVRPLAPNVATSSGFRGHRALPYLLT
jgi:hypothetical protein